MTLLKHGSFGFPLSLVPSIMSSQVVVPHDVTKYFLAFYRAAGGALPAQYYPCGYTSTSPDPVSSSMLLELKGVEEKECGRDTGGCALNECLWWASPEYWGVRAGAHSGLHRL